MNGLPYYKAYPRDFFEGTVGMDFEVKAAYRLVLDLIYMHGGRLADDPRFISGHLGCSVRKWWALRSAILATGKIRLDGDYLANYRADKVLDEAKMFQSKQRDNALKARKNNGIGEAMAEPKVSHTEPDADTDKSSEAKASDSDAVGDPVKAVFDAGLSVLMATGTPERQARALLGKLRRDHAGRDGDILTAIMDCRRAGAVDPIPWITARLTKPKQPSVAEIMARIPPLERPQ